MYRAEVTSKSDPFAAPGRPGRARARVSGPPAQGTATVEVYLTGRQAEKLEKRGVHLTEHTLAGQGRESVQAAQGQGVPPVQWQGADLQEEILRTDGANPGSPRLNRSGRRSGQDTRPQAEQGRRRIEGRRETLRAYMSNQHAREWIMPEMTRRLMHDYPDNYPTDNALKKLVDFTEPWFVLLADPDGDDYMFQSEDNRQWRRTCVTTSVMQHHHGRRCRPQPQLRLQVGLRRRGIVPEPAERDLPRRGHGLRARDRRSTPSRSASASTTASTTTPPPSCCSTGWAGRWPRPPPTTSTTRRSPAPRRTRRSPATTRRTPRSSTPPTARRTATRQRQRHGDVHAEMSTCQTASDIDPNDAWKPRGLRVRLQLPGRRKLIQQEFAKNVPFALSVAETAAHPDRRSPPWA